MLQFKIPVHDSFVDYDRHKTGAISRPQFRRGLAYAFGDSYVRSSITDAEMQALEGKYRRELIDGDHFVDWRAFCKKLTEVLLTADLERTMDAPPTERALERPDVTLSSEEEARVAELLGKMSERFRIRSVYVKAPFHDFAKSTNSPMCVDHCTRQQFVQGLSALGIEPTVEELELLFRKYDDHGEGTVNYVAFSRDVDVTETFSDRLPAKDTGTSLFGGFREPKVHEHLVRAL